jgi:hypothetical protein
MKYPIVAAAGRSVLGDGWANLSINKKQEHQRKNQRKYEI